MDIVRRLIEDDGGHLGIESRDGLGTSISLRLPLEHTVVESVRFLADGHERVQRYGKRKGLYVH
ncbi:hypothetical protein LQE92_12505 [Lacrimispora sp. NSJ-141]|uniref:Histidine kinase/HSP90-like ATPase domain-containing protein n=1 Tax=Lientehia hominis TaxID=2897778 RepID=A0AAP2W9L7_9FIRM|nr:hypothetical protein [Lientehia hominis]MCD2493436.1 hypothetical protein [Lientehia hominis]